MKSLKDIVYEKCDRKYGNNIPKEIEDRLQQELNIIETKGYETHYLQTYRITNGLSSSHVPFIINGFTSYSLVAYLLGLTEVNPLDYGLRNKWFFGVQGNKEPDFTDIRTTQQGISLVIAYLKTIGRVAPIKDEKGRNCGFLLKDKLGLDIDTISKQELLDKDISTKYYFKVQRYTLLDFIERKLEETKLELKDIPTNDEEVYEYFHSLGTRRNIIPIDKELEINMKNIIFGQKPQKELVEKILSGNLNEEVMTRALGVGHLTVGKDKHLTLEETEYLCDRDSLLEYLLEKGLEEDKAFEIASATRKGLFYKGRVSQEMIDTILELEDGERILDGIEKIIYFFPRGHALAQLQMLCKAMWLELNYQDKSNVASNMN